ncbi:hypothetical protein Moror_17706 [Moniliophthora roreri MCA 2997]|uniref:Uncharacterized protein n=1 Tax=Moniliophthora roreri (strain MCA 2997) TaxID=1381753 RepID=V2XXX8_MONRO|nr:hypothetical protein Moror_17706 [Moniliophthora roreri MCA 2997]
MTQLGPSDTPFLLTTTSHDARFKDNPGTELEPILQKLSSSYFAISYGNKRTSAFRKGNEDVLQNKTNLISSHLISSRRFAPTDHSSPSVVASLYPYARNF